MAAIEIDAVRFQAGPLAGQLGVLVDAEDDFGLFDARGEFVTCWGAYEFETDEEFLAAVPEYEFVDHIPEGLQETLRKVAAWVKSVSAPGSRPPVVGRYNRPADATP